MNIGIDTGFFVELLAGTRMAVEVWTDLIEGKTQGHCSSLTLFEIERLGMKGVVNPKGVDALLDAIPVVCRLAWIERKETLSLAARMSHGLGIPAVDSLILAGFVQAGVERIYTTDKHMESYKAKGVKVVNLTS